MTRTYKLHRNILGEVNTAFYKENGQKIHFPFDPDNTDYQEYLKWLAEGNTPEPPDEPNP